jgi:steroid delta-isomerase-like uncharacterized protein
MSADDNTALVHCFMEVICYDGDLAVLDAITAPDYVHHAPSGSHDLQWFKGTVRAFQAGFPDWRIVIEEMIAEGDRVWARWTMTGTHTGEFMGIAPTGRHLHTTDGLNTFRLADGKIAEDTPRWRGVWFWIVHQLGATQP